MNTESLQYAIAQLLEKYPLPEVISTLAEHCGSRAGESPDELTKRALLDSMGLLFDAAEKVSRG